MKIFILIIFILAAIIIFLIGIFLPKNKNLPPASPSPLPTNTPFFSPEPSPSPTSAPVYNSSGLTKDYSRIASPQPLVTTDAQVRQKLIDSLGNQSGTLTQTADFRIEYDKAPNSFMVEILSNNAESAKNGAVSWFLEQGLSSRGVCNLPVVFYLGSEARSYYQQNNLQFNPVPNGC